MKRKISLLLATVWAQGLMGDAYAHTPAQSYAPSHKPVQFYAGLSGGVERMTSRQNQSVSYPAGVGLGVPSDITFLSNRSQSSKNGYYSAFGGMTWNIPDTSLFLGPEIYVGRSNTQIENRITVPDDVNLVNRVMQTSISASNFIGGSIQAGCKLPAQLRAYVLLGVESSQFRYTTFYVPRSHNALTGGVSPDIPPASFAATKWLSGFSWGFGLEKEFNSFRLGGDIRLIHYRELKASYVTDSADAIHSLETISNAFKPKNIRFSIRWTYLF